MAFGKRQVPPPGPASAPPDQPAGPPAPAATEPSLAETEFPGARRVTPDLVEFGDGEPAADGAARIVGFLADAYRGEQSTETILSAAGALAGFAAQQALWEGLVRPGQGCCRAGLHARDDDIRRDSSSATFWNTILASTLPGELSIWRLVAAGIAGRRRPGAAARAAVRASCGDGGDTGIRHARLSEEAAGSRSRRARRCAIWPRIKTILVTSGKAPIHWPLEIAVAAPETIRALDHEMPADIAALIVMEAAIPMSKIDPRTVPGGTMVD